MIGELIGAGATLLGGLFGKKKKAPEVTKTETTSTVDYVKMAEEAQKAGFNPLTAIRNGGSAGFGSGTSISTQPALSTSPDYGALFGNFGAAIADAFDPVARKQRQVESALYDYQLKTLQSGGKMPKGIGGAPTKAGSRYAVRTTPAVGGKVYGPWKNAPGQGKLVGGDDPTVSSLGMNNGRYGWFHAPWMADAEIGETIYGENEILSTVYGGLKLTADGVYSAYRNGYSGLEDMRAATLALPNKQSKSQEKFVKDYNANLDRMFGAKYKQKLKHASW